MNDCCPRCGSIDGWDGSVCGHCEPLSPDVELVPSTEDPSEQELGAFVGPRAHYYLDKWRAVGDGAGGGVGFNLAAFFLSGLWLPYRKMYRITAIFFGILLLESILEELLFVGILGLPESPVVLSRIVGVVAGVVCGIFGNRWYLSHAQRAVAKVRRQELLEEDRLRSLAVQGGTSLVASLGFFALFVLATMVSLFLLDLFVTADFGPKIEFGGGEEVYYANSATEADAQALGAFLREAGYFDGRSPKSVRISLDGDGLVIGFVVQDRVLKDAQFDQEFRTIGQQASQKAFRGRPVRVELCDEYFKVQKRL